MGTLLLLVGCGSEEEKELGSIGDKVYTEKDFIGDLVEDADVDGIQGMFLAKVLEEKSTDEVKEKVIEEQMKEFEEDEIDELSEEDEEQFNQLAKQDAGLINVLTESGIVTQEDIEKYHKENDLKYKLDVVVVEDEKEVEDIKSILKAGKEVEEEIKEKDLGVEYYGNLEYTDITLPEYLPNMSKSKKGDVHVAEAEELVFVIKVNEVSKTDLEDIKNEVILTLGEEETETVSGLLKELDDKGVIKLSKDMREYLKLDDEKAE